jgi:hypothetical protein
MRGDPHVHRTHRARAVADAPLDALAADADGLARRWAIALIDQRPLERIGEIRLEAFALEAPPLCALLVRSLGSDAELERITGRDSGGSSHDATPASTLRALAGARSGAAVVEAVEALRGVLWDALLGELRWPAADQSPSRLLADLADRLAYVCASVLAAILAHDPVVAAGELEVVTTPGAAPVDELDRRSRHARVVLIDERGDAPARSSATSPIAPSHGLEGRAPVGSQGADGRGQMARRTASGAMPSVGRPDRSRASGTPTTRARPLPWDAPLRSDRADHATETELGEGRRTERRREDGEGTAGEGGAAGDPTIRVTRRATPVDGAT